MSLTSARSDVARIQRDIADLRSKDAAEAKKEADTIAKQHRAQNDARSTKSVSTMTSKLRDAERAANDLATIQKTRADLARSLASKLSDLNRYQDTLGREEERDRKRVDDATKKQDKARTKQLADLDRRLRERQNAIASLPELSTPVAGEDQTYDVFISHAWEDKEAFVRPLAESLVAAGLRVWYDGRILKVGDSLRREIDKGLAQSRYGIVILSESFFRKEWPQRELDGLVQLERLGKSRILPIWHKVTKDEVASFSPTLSDKMALNTGTMTVAEITEQLLLVCGKIEEEPAF